MALCSGKAGASTNPNIIATAFVSCDLGTQVTLQMIAEFPVCDHEILRSKAELQVDTVAFGLSLVILTESIWGAKHGAKSYGESVCHAFVFSICRNAPGFGLFECATLGLRENGRATGRTHRPCGKTTRRYQPTGLARVVQKIHHDNFCSMRSPL